MAWIRKTSHGAGPQSLRRKIAFGLLVTAGLLSFRPLPVAAEDKTADSEYFDIIRSIDLLGDVYREVSKNYVDNVNVSALMYSGIDGMLRTLDPYSVFLDQESAEELDEHTTGQYVGVGVSIMSIDGKFYVSTVNDGYSASRAGLRVGDRILSVNGLDTSKNTPDAIRTAIKGDVGTTVTMVLERLGRQASFTVKLPREDVQVSTIELQALIGDVGYIRMESFGTRSGRELREALLALRRQSAKRQQPMKGVILDLRNNPGGLLNAAVEVASLFAPKGSTVVSIKGRSPEMSKTYVTESDPVDTTIPLILLINEQSASASEIVSGFVQDLDRGIVLGSRSFGKGLVQSVIRISYDSSLKLTIAKYYTPSGRLIQKPFRPMNSKRPVVSASRDGDAATPFRTRGGRTVYGGGGISPDIEVREPELPPYIEALKRKGLLFLYANEVVAAIPVKPTQPFVRQKLLESFESFLRRQKFSYTSEAERNLNNLMGSIKSINPELRKQASEHLPVLQADVDLARNEEIAGVSDALASALEVEILRHYDLKSSRLRALQDDLAVTRAVSLFSDLALYNEILQPRQQVAN